MSAEKGIDQLEDALSRNENAYSESNEKSTSQINITKKELEKVQLQLENSKKQVEKFRDEINKLTKKVKEIEPLKKQNAELIQQNHKLHDDLKAAKDLADQQHVEHQKELDKLKSDRDKLQSELEALKTTIHQQEKDKSPEASLPESKSTFRLHLYPHEGSIKGKIEHLLSEDHITFSGIDGQSIVRFLQAHSPQEPTTKATTKARAATPETVPAQAQRPQVAVQKLDILPHGQHRPTRTIRHDEPFQVRLTLDLMDKKETAEVHLDYSASIYAKSLRGGTSKLIASGNDMITGAGSLAVNVLPFALSPGAYKLESAVSILSKEGTAHPLSVYHRSRMVNVY